MSIPEPSSMYVPLESLTEAVIRSVTSVVCSRREESWNFSRRTLLAFLLALDEKLTAIEQQSATDKTDVDPHTAELRRWLVDSDNEPLDWNQLRRRYEVEKERKHDEMARYFGITDTSSYFELEIPTRFAGVEQSRRYMDRSRKDGFKPEELKLYWNVEQLENLCTAPTAHDPADLDAVENLRKYPVDQRNHAGTITYVNEGIQKAVFQIPENAQIIVLNFANEQSPGGGYLRNAKAQEEIMLNNSDGFRALLDLKYHRMCGGYAIPEFGLAYVRKILFYDADSDKTRAADMMVSACYCWSGRELYANPRNAAERKKQTLAKFRAFMAAAVANTVGDGSDTYLLLGPIGTGAFGNDVNQIGELFRDVLQLPLMQSKQPVRQAFGNIWFVSTDQWKNEAFEKIIGEPERK